MIKLLISLVALLMFSTSVHPVELFGTHEVDVKASSTTVDNPFIEWGAMTKDKPTGSINDAVEINIKDIKFVLFQKGQPVVDIINVSNWDGIAAYLTFEVPDNREHYRFFTSSDEDGATREITYEMVNLSNKNGIIDSGSENKLSNVPGDNKIWYNYHAIDEGDTITDLYTGESIDSNNEDTGAGYQWMRLTKVRIVNTDKQFFDSTIKEWNNIDQTIYARGFVSTGSDDTVLDGQIVEQLVFGLNLPTVVNVNRTGEMHIGIQIFGFDAPDTMDIEYSTDTTSEIVGAEPFYRTDKFFGIVYSYEMEEYIQNFIYWESEKEQLKVRFKGEYANSITKYSAFTDVLDENSGVVPPKLFFHKDQPLWESTGLTAP